MSYITTARPIFNKTRGQEVMPIEYVRLVVSTKGVKDVLDRSFFYWNNDSRGVLLYGGTCEVTNTGSYNFETVEGSRSLALVVGARYREHRNKSLDRVGIDGILELDYRVESFSCKESLPIELVSDIKSEYIAVSEQYVSSIRDQINQLGQSSVTKSIIEIQQILQNLLELIK